MKLAKFFRFGKNNHHKLTKFANNCQKSINFAQFDLFTKNQAKGIVSIFALMFWIDHHCKGSNMRVHTPNYFCWKSSLYMLLFKKYSNKIGEKALKFQKQVTLHVYLGLHGYSVP